MKLCSFPWCTEQAIGEWTTPPVTETRRLELVLPPIRRCERHAPDEYRLSFSLYPVETVVVGDWVPELVEP